MIHVFVLMLLVPGIGVNAARCAPGDVLTTAFIIALCIIQAWRVGDGKNDDAHEEGEEFHRRKTKASTWKMKGDGLF